MSFIEDSPSIPNTIPRNQRVFYDGMAEQDRLDWDAVFNLTKNLQEKMEVRLDNTPREVWSRIAAEARRNRWTLQEVVSMTGVSKTTLFRMRHQQTKSVQSKVLRRLCEAFDWTLREAAPPSHFGSLQYDEDDEERFRNPWTTIVEDDDPGN